MPPPRHVTMFRFKNRIVEMVHDKEENVAVQAVKLISFMLNSFDVLENADCEVRR